MGINNATKAYEAWLSKRIPLIDTDLRLKHQRMAQSAFAFLRATFYRWVQLWPQVCPELATAPSVLGVGDLHIENFGTWRDREGRLIWGVNDFDEAAMIAYANDLVRLVLSARLAISENHLSCDPADAGDAILTGYRDGFERGGAPFVLAEDHRWLFDLAVSERHDPALYWQKFNELPALRAGIPPPVKAALKSALPEPGLSLRFVHRRAGLGSLGRRRFAALTQWRGGWIAREAKELVVSAWHWDHEDRGSAGILYQQAIDQAVRVPDPFLSVNGRWLIRRLAPDCGRIELGSLPRTKEQLKLLHAMGWETANIHLGTKAAASRVRRDLSQRTGKWLLRAADSMAKATLNDWKVWAKP